MEKTLNLHIAMFLSHLNSDIPLIKQHAAIHSLLILSHLLITFYRIFSHPSQLESISQLIEQRIIFRNLFNYLGQAIIILNHCKALHQASVVLSREVEFCSTVPL